jgi:hypothetical protein
MPVQSYAFRTGLCSADLSVNRKGVRSTATRARVKTSLIHRRLAPPQCLQRHSENTDEIVHQECQIGRMDYEREVRSDSLPGLHIHVRLMFPAPDRIVKIYCPESDSCPLESFVR